MKPLRILIGCESSGMVRDAFRALGHEAYSCDTEPAVGDATHHLQRDVREILHDDWDRVIAFPPCTHLAVSGAHRFAEKRADGRQQKAWEFFMMFTRLKCPWAIENPVGIMSTHYRKPDQIVQPFWFGDPESKKTCLWLNFLPKLKPTNILPLPECGYWQNQTPSGQNKLGPSANRQYLRSLTYQGIARAMAAQWA